MPEYRVSEHFVSINGEGRRAGELSLFIRFTGCDLRCSYCDTLYAVEKDAPHTLLSAAELTDIAKASGVRNVTLTGGEPLQQPEIGVLIGLLCKAELRVEIETNGAVYIAPFLGAGCTLTMDYKLPSSRMEQHMCTENLPLLRDCDTLKFVCGSREDLLRAREVIAEYHPRAAIYLSPVFGQIEPAEMVDFMKEYNMTDVRLQLQLHKFIWPPEMRGV